MDSYGLADDFRDATTERQVIRAISENRAAFWRVEQIVTEETFSEERNAWRQLEHAIRNGLGLPIIPDWGTTDDPEAKVRTLNELAARRNIAAGLEKVSNAIFGTTTNAESAITELERTIVRARAAFREGPKISGQTLTDLMPVVMAEVEGWERLRKEQGPRVIGLKTGLPKFDGLLDGLRAGLLIIAGGPGVGKTSFAQHIASEVCGQVPVIFVTFENSPKNLILKGICSRAGIQIRDVEHGCADTRELITAALDWMKNGAERISFVDGSANFSVVHLQQQMRAAMERWNVSRCFVVVDFLQVWAKAAHEYRRLDSVRTRVEALGADLGNAASNLNSPILAISSQNREHGGYGDGAGRTSMESLKESGDLEYLADVVMFLVNSKFNRPTPPLRSLELVIKKNRYGDVGAVPLRFRPDTSNFREDRHA